MMARPARVRIRSRKPCVFARRRLFGWKVRLLTVGLQQSQGSGCTSGRPGLRGGSVVPTASPVGERRPIEVTHLRYGSAPPRVKPTRPQVPAHEARTHLRAPAPTRGQPHTRPASRGKPAKISRPESIPAATRRTLLSSTDTAVSFPDQPLRRSTPTRQLRARRAHLSHAQVWENMWTVPVARADI